MVVYRLHKKTAVKRCGWCMDYTRKLQRIVDGGVEGTQENCRELLMVVYRLHKKHAVKRCGWCIEYTRKLQWIVDWTLKQFWHNFWSCLRSKLYQHNRSKIVKADVVNMSVSFTRGARISPPRIHKKINEQSNEQSVTLLIVTCNEHVFHIGPNMR